MIHIKNKRNKKKNYMQAVESECDHVLGKVSRVS